MVDGYERGFWREGGGAAAGALVADTELLEERRGKPHLVPLGWV